MNIPVVFVANDIDMSTNVCRGEKIEIMKKKYTYNQELDGPRPGVDITNDSPLMLLYIRWNKLVNRILSDTWKPPEGVKKKQLYIPTRDGSKISSWLLEPQGSTEILPAILFCHGGAFFMPILNSSLTLAASYVRKLGCRIVMPEYRLTPKHRYPIPSEDCCDTLKYMIQEADYFKLDMDRLIIYGESAGGCLATEVTHFCRDKGLVHPMGQMLIYPVTDFSQEYPSIVQYQFAPWSRLANLNMWKLYLPSDLPEEAVPMAQEYFRGFPPTYVEASEIDILRDQDLAYAEKMRAAGVEVQSETIPGAYHGFDSEINSPLVQRILTRRVEVMRQMLFK